MSFSKNFGFFFLLVLLLTLVDFFYLERPATGIDDANIFFTYARNISNGHGFVFNVNGEKVEGFTSLLWVLICAAAYSVSSSYEFLLMFLLMLFTALSITMVYREVEKDVEILDPMFNRKYFFWIYCAFIMCIGPAFIAWSVLSLMENGLWNFLFLSCIVLLLKGYRLPAYSSLQKTGLLVFSMLLVFTRPEGFAWGFLFTLILFLIYKKQKKNPGFPILYFLLLVAASLALTYFRKTYFGYPLPNTYYAKVSHDLLYNVKSGLGYAIRFITAYHPLITLLFVVLTIISLRSLKLILSIIKTETVYTQNFVLHRIIIVSCIIVASILLPITTGGDHFGGFRFYQSIILVFAWGIPAILLLYQESLLRRNKKSIISLGYALVIFFLLVSAGSLYNVKSTPKNQLNYEFYLAKEGRRTASEFNDLWQDQFPSVGVVAAGGFALNYKGQTVDLMGLNNTLMGHSKGSRTGIKNHAAFNKDVFYQLHPDLLLPVSLEKESHALLKYAEYLNRFNFENQAMKDIFNDSLFHQAYLPVMIKRRSTQHPFFVFASRDYLQSAEKDTSLKISVIQL